MQTLITIAALILGGGAALVYQWRVHRRDQRILGMWERGYDETGDVAILSWMSLSGGDSAPPASSTTRTATSTTRRSRPAGRKTSTEPATKPPTDTDDVA